MNNSFYKTVLTVNYIFIGLFIASILFANLYYRTTATVIIAVIIALVLVYKLKRIERAKKDFDERSEVIYYKSLGIGMYCLLIVIFFFYAMELTKNNGIISARTTVELFAVLGGYIGSNFYYRRKY
ncbi:MAG: hypothetical protein ACM3KR_07300 [Deltaproteobacteria bacterium]